MKQRKGGRERKGETDKAKQLIPGRAWWSDVRLPAGNFSEMKISEIEKIHPNSPELSGAIYVQVSFPDRLKKEVPLCFQFHFLKCKTNEFAVSLKFIFEELMLV